jgi:hypothetical protein
MKPPNGEHAEHLRRLALLFSVSLLTFILASCSDLGSNPDGSVQEQTPNPASGVSFKNDVAPIFNRYGCTACHGSSGGLSVQTVDQLLRGGSSGPSVIAGNADGSILVKKLLPSPPFGVRMPQGGPFIPDTTLQIIRTWINQGAKNN